MDQTTADKGLEEGDREGVEVNHGHIACRVAQEGAEAHPGEGQEGGTRSGIFLNQPPDGEADGQAMEYHAQGQGGGRAAGGAYCDFADVWKLPCLSTTGAEPDVGRWTFDAPRADRNAPPNMCVCISAESGPLTVSAEICI